MATISRSRPPTVERRRPKGPETLLFERSLKRLITEERSRCADCGRVPLTGETVFHFERSRLVCELCKPLRAGEPERSEVVHSCEHNLSVRRAAPGHVSSAPPWAPSSSRSPSIVPARRSSPTSPTSPTTPSSPITT